MKQIPKRVLRFYGNPQYALEDIERKQITFLHKDKLNDPFDPYYYFETDFNEDYQEIINYVKQNHPNNLENFRKTMPQAEFVRRIKIIIEELDRRSKRTFIFSTIDISEDNHQKDNLYMWSHYADGHRGVALEFDTQLLTKTALEQMKKPKIKK